MGEGNVFTAMCHSVNRGGGGVSGGGGYVQGGPKGAVVSLGYAEIRSTGGRYASYRNAFLFAKMDQVFSLKKILENRGKYWKSRGIMSVRKNGNHG